MQAYLGGLYVNDFNRNGRVYQVLIPRPSTSSATRSPIHRPALRAQRGAGSMVPLRSLTTTREKLPALPESLKPLQHVPFRGREPRRAPRRA